MGTAVALLFILAIGLLVLWMLRRLYRWAFKRNGRPLKLNAEEFKGAIEDAEKATRAMAIGSTAAAAVLAPTGFKALLVSVGFVGTPLIAVLAPKIGAVAAGLIALSCVMALYCKLRATKQSAK